MPTIARARSTVVSTAACAGTRRSQQLVGPEAQQVEHPGVELGQRPGDQPGQDASSVPCARSVP